MIPGFYGISRTEFAILNIARILSSIGMKISEKLFRELLPPIFAGLVPLAILFLIATGTVFGLVAWRPPIVPKVMFGTANSESGITALTSDASGIYAAGYAGFGLSSATSAYLFVDKYDLNGLQVWTQHFDNPNDPFDLPIQSIAVGSHAVYVAGSANRSAFVRAYDLSGNEIWNTQVEGSAAGLSLDSTSL